MTAVAAAAGCELHVPKMDYDSLDCQVISFAGRRPQLWVQLKATSQPCVANGRVTFRLPVRNYNHLRTVERTVPAVLVVLHLPTERTDWLSHNIDSLLLRNNAYYFNLAGHPEVQNRRNVTIRIPTGQRLTSDSLLRLLDCVSNNRALPL